MIGLVIIVVNARSFIALQQPFANAQQILFYHRLCIFLQLN